MQHTGKMTRCHKVSGWGQLILFTVGFFVAACSPAEKQAPAQNIARITPWSLPVTTAPSGGEVVATVNSVPIYSETVAARARERCLPVKEALESCINDELLYQVAQRQRRPGQMAEVLKAQAVHTLIAEEFEKKQHPDEIDDTTLRKVYNEIQAPAFSKMFGRLKFLFVREQWRRPHQMVIKKRYLPTPDVESSAKSMLNLVRSWYELQARDSPELFRQSAWFIQNSYYRVDYENTFDPVSMKWAENFYRSGRAYDPKFKDALFAIPRVNGTAPPFLSQFGAHWVFLKKIYPAQNMPFEKVKENLRQKLSLSYKTRAFASWLSRLREKYSATIAGGGTGRR